MRSSIATVSVSGTLDSKLRALAAARFDAVEIFENDLLTFSGSAREVRGMLDELGLACCCFQPFRDFEGMPEPQRSRTFERLERKFDLMQELGAPLLLVCSNVSPASSGERSRLVDDLRELGARAQARGLRVGYEALAWGRHIYDHRDAWSLVRAVDHPAVGLILDTFHSLARRVPIESLNAIDMRKVFLVQIADAPLLEMDALSWSRHYRNMPGQGDFPLAEYMTAVVRGGYDGYWSLEIFNDRFRAGSASSVALDGHRSLILLNDEVEQREHPEGPLLRPRVLCRGVEFLEFAANEDEAPQLGTMFHAMGFHLAGRHRNKDVVRWSQNGVNFVINSEPDSFARTYDHAHGASVCAVGLRVTDVEAAMRRAQSLQIPIFSQPLGPGEMLIPSIRGPGDSLIYFIRDGEEARVWQQEFTSARTVDQRNAAIESVDHLDVTLFYEDLPSWLLYYTGLFRLNRTPPVEFADPQGLVSSQAMESEDGRFRILLNASANPQTLAARFLRHYVGAGVQSIALRCADIIATAQKLRDYGLEVLPIPRNYYDDVLARGTLTEEHVGRLAELNILYDTDGSGEYFQLFSRAFAKRFFFEFVQRRDYGAYGSANASIRLAAQSRYKTASPVIA
jgi:4-hydroxyphenylpyruvate dioxygenase